MRESFFERYGSWLAIGLVTLFVWQLVSGGLQESEAFRFFFPLHWIEALPFAPAIHTFLDPFRSASWWMWVEIAVTVFTWMLIYLIGRGIHSAIRSMEGLSMWVAFVLCIVVAIAFVLIILAPAFDQLAIWRSAWPKEITP